jgi:FkbM family methyltransferase
LVCFDLAKNITLGKNMTSIKNYLPHAIRRPLGNGRAVLRRLSIWYDVRRTLSGASAGDHSILRRAVLSAPITVFRNLDRWVDPVVDQDCIIVSKGIGTFGVRANSDDLYHVLPGREPPVIGTIRKMLRSGDVFVDAGANIGVYSVLASNLVGPDGKVISIEMMPDTAAILRTHIEMNALSNVCVVEFALADRDGATVTASVQPGKFGQASIAHKTGDDQVQVKTRTLSTILMDVGHVRLLKMDLEGAEIVALQGLGAAASKIDSILFEDWGNDITAALDGMGYKVTRLDGNNSLAVRKDVQFPGRV